jgi:pilus assembly protein CpaF
MSDVRSEAQLVADMRERIYRDCDAEAILAFGAGAAGRVRALTMQFLSEERRVLSGEAMERVVNQVVASATGLGPLQELIEDDSVSEIMVNGPRAVFVERGGRIEPVHVGFLDDEHVRQVIDRILAPIVRRIDAMSPIVVARLPDGSSINDIVTPLALEGPVLTIRKFLPTARTLADLQRLGSLTRGDVEAVAALVSSRANVLVAGPTSSGKTTLLGAALSSCDTVDRIVVIEDSAELPLEHEHRVRLEARPATFESSGAISVRDLVRNALRMRPDRIIVGEVRGGEAFDMVQALSTGHRGCWSTVHANSAEDALLRVESMSSFADVAVPMDVLRKQIARAIDAVIFVDRCADGVRRLRQVAQVVETAGGWALEQRAVAS